MSSVLASLPLYLFSMFKAPKKVIREIEKLQRMFLWGGSEEHRRMSWVRWSQVCKSKKEGGLGVKNLYFLNLSLLAKWRWRILKGDNSTLWEHVLVERYGREYPWFGNSLSAYSARKSSIWWRDLALLGSDSPCGGDWFKEVVKRRIGNGLTVKFWSDTWIGTEPLSGLFPSVMEAHGVQNAMVADLGEWTERGWQWRWSTLGTATVFGADLDSSTIAALTDFVDFLRGIQLNLNEDDAWVWAVDKPKGFTVKSCYNWLCNRVTIEDPLSDQSIVKACTSLWKCDIPSKVLVFCWRLLLRKIPTRENLLNRGIISSLQDAKCVFCRCETESVDHLFCRCPVVQEVWRGVLDWLNVQAAIYDDIILMYEGMGELIKGKGARRVKIIFWAATVYQVWLARNGVVFNNNTISARSIVTSIKYVSWGWFIARRGRNSGLGFSDWFCSPMGCISTL